MTQLFRERPWTRMTMWMRTNEILITEGTVSGPPFLFPFPSLSPFLRCSTDMLDQSNPQREISTIESSETTSFRTQKTKAKGTAEIAILIPIPIIPTPTHPTCTRSHNRWDPPPPLLRTALPHPTVLCPCLFPPSLPPPPPLPLLLRW